MATEVAIPGGDWTAKAEKDLSSYRYHLLELSGNEQVDVCDGASDVIVGVQQNKDCDAAGKGVQVRSYGISKVVAGGALAAGDKVGPDTDGHAIAKTSDADSVCGIVISGVDSEGQLATILLTPGAQRAS